MEEKDLICIMCPIGCHLHVDKEGQISGNKCKRGLIYGLEEIKSPKRMLTSTVKTTFIDMPRLPVKTSNPIPKALIFKAMEKLNDIIIKNNVKIGDIIIKNICNTDVDVIATRSYRQ